MSLNKDAVVARAREIYAAKHAGRLEQRACLYWATSFNEAANEHGLRAIIQAGSAQFQFRDDDGESITHFSYMFDKEAAAKRLAQGLFPEIHVWSGIPETGEIVDLSVRYQPMQALELANLIWTPEYKMPDYFWRYGVTDGRFRYMVDMHATLLAMRTLGQLTNANFRQLVSMSIPKNKHK